MKISLITVAYNARDTINGCIESVISQNYTDLEYIIIDGGSTDGTQQIINQYKANINLFISEPDKGIYDAMNKGIKMASGKVIGMLNADDFFADETVLKSIAYTFNNTDTDIVYGNLDIINPSGKIIRKWRTAQCGITSFNWGFMPPHPTFYCKRELFKKLGFYSLEYGSAADYELMVRFMHNYKVKSLYLNKVMVKMLAGGVSNQNFKNRIYAWLFDLKAMKNNGVKCPVISLLLKVSRKLNQFRLFTYKGDMIKQ